MPVGFAVARLQDLVALFLKIGDPMELATDGELLLVGL